MSDKFEGLWSSIYAELLQVESLIKGTRCVRENEPDANVETDLLSLVENKIDESRKLLEAMRQEHREREKEKKKAEA